MIYIKLLLLVIEFTRVYGQLKAADKSSGRGSLMATIRKNIENIVVVWDKSSLENCKLTHFYYNFLIKKGKLICLYFSKIII